MNVMDPRIKYYILVFCLSIVLLEVSSKRDKVESKNQTLCIGFISCGYTVPIGDIVLQYGEPLNITCNIYPESAHSRTYGKNASSYLYFTRGEEELWPTNSYDPNNETSEKVEILNSTSIRLTIKKPEKMKRGSFICNFKNKKSSDMACQNVVTVGTPPQEIKDFSCRSHNLEYMSCSWTPPENYVVTQYSVGVSYPIYSNRKSQRGQKKLELKGVYNDSKHQQLYMLPAPLDDNKSGNMSFNLTTNDPPFYRQARELFIFSFNISNPFGTISQSFEWKHFENLIPRPPEGLIAEPKSPSTIQLSWNISSILCSLKQNFTYRVMYNCEKFCKKWKVELLNEQSCMKRNMPILFNLTNLEYAHVLYDIRVSFKLSIASDNMWSDNTSDLSWTESKIPDYPPQTTLGSFQLVEKQENSPRQVLVYFQQIRPEAENGENFRYYVESQPPLKLVTITQAYAIFDGLEEDKEYKMNIWAKNQVGTSQNHSVVVIPAKRIKELYQVWKIFHKSDKYELEWEPPKTDMQITNYTLFWCEHKTDRPHQCEGYLNWTIVPSNLTKYNVTLMPTNKVYQFAIAANSAYGSSGMSWISCTVLANKTVGIISELYVGGTGTDYIDLQWKILCPHAIKEITGYVIYYCVTNTTFNNTCDSPENQITIDGNINTESARVSNLTSYTTYLLAVSVKTKNAIGERTEYLRNHTTEAAPSSPPVNITFTQTTNSTISLQWSQPPRTNGVIKKYRIYVNNTIFDLNGSVNNYTVTELESNKEYSISMEACTVECSEKSKSETVSTKMGTPSEPSRPYVLKNDGSMRVISWDKPNPSRGDLNYYEVRIVYEDNTEYYQNVYTEEFAFQFCDTTSGKFAKSLEVRAFNIIDNERYAGPWSQKYMETSCHQDFRYIALYIGIAVVFVAALVFLIRKLYAHCVIMQDVQIKLPDGLETVAGNSEKSTSDITKFCPDEELLLEKLDVKCQAGDSSGCSSGQESIASSVESTVHSIDSGMDQPRNVIDDIKENSLRLRNVSSRGYVLHDPTPVVNRGTKPAPPTPTGNYCVIGVDNTKPSPTPPSNYCVVGVDPTTKPVKDSPYVTLSDIRALPQP